MLNKGKKMLCLGLMTALCVASTVSCGMKPKKVIIETEATESETETVQETVKETKPKKVEAEVKDGTQDVAIFGVDARDNNLDEGTRSDSIMIMHIDHNDKTIKVVSVFRDCMLNIEGHGYEKATHAHSYGGPTLALNMLNTNLDLDIKNYVTLNFIAVGDLVDMIGGVEQEITPEEVQYMNSYITEVNQVRGTGSAQISTAGTYTLDGTQAVAYSRIRYTAGGDYKRSERQRTILFKLFEKAKTLGTMDRISVADKMMREINSNFFRGDMEDLINCLEEYTIQDMTAFPQVFYGGTVDGAWVEVPKSLEDMAAGIHQFFYGDAAYTPSETVRAFSSDLDAKAPTANVDMNSSKEEQ